MPKPLYRATTFTTASVPVYSAKMGTGVRTSCIATGVWVKSPVGAVVGPVAGGPPLPFFAAAHASSMSFVFKSASSCTAGSIAIASAKFLIPSSLLICPPICTTPRSRFNCARIGAAHLSVPQSWIALFNLSDALPNSVVR